MKMRLIVLLAATFGYLGVWCQTGGRATQGPKNIPDKNWASPAAAIVLPLADDADFADLLLLATDRSSVSKLWNSSQQPQKTSSNPALYQTCPDGRPSCGAANVCCSGSDKCCWNGNTGRYECMSVTACPNRHQLILSRLADQNARLLSHQKITSRLSMIQESSSSDPSGRKGRALKKVVAQASLRGT
jgi:hypothetical protein